MVGPGFSAIRESAEGGVRRRRWDVADLAQAYRTRLVTPSDVATSILDSLRQSEAADPPMRFLISQDPEDLLAQARAATARCPFSLCRQLHMSALTDMTWHV